MPPAQVNVCVTVRGVQSYVPLQVKAAGVDPNCKLVVSRTGTLDAKAIRAMFEPFGVVRHMKMVREKETGIVRGARSVECGYC